MSTLDGRVTNSKGRPVESRQASVEGGGWWFRVRRADGPAGVELVTRIPGYHEDEVVTTHADEQHADNTAQIIYDAYVTVVKSAVTSK